jgi:hypothetical protein
MAPLKIMGIDPGDKGSVCIYTPQINEILFINTSDDAFYIRKIIEEQRAQVRDFRAYIEDVHSIFGMSAKSNFSFGWNVGKLHTILQTLEMDYNKVQPKKWQADTGIVFPKKTATVEKKRIVAARALELYPKAIIHGPRGGLLDGRSDALMIMHYGKLQYELEASSRNSNK